MIDLSSTILSQNYCTWCCCFLQFYITKYYKVIVRNHRSIDLDNCPPIFWSVVDVGMMSARKETKTKPHTVNNTNKNTRQQGYRRVPHIAPPYSTLSPFQQPSLGWSVAPLCILFLVVTSIQLVTIFSRPPWLLAKDGEVFLGGINWWYSPA